MPGLPAVQYSGGEPYIVFVAMPYGAMPPQAMSTPALPQLAPNVQTYVGPQVPTWSQGMRTLPALQGHSRQDAAMLPLVTSASSSWSPAIGMDRQSSSRPDGGAEPASRGGERSSAAAAGDAMQAVPPSGSHKRGPGSAPTRRRRRQRAFQVHLPDVPHDSAPEGTGVVAQRTSPPSPSLATDTRLAAHIGERLSGDADAWNEAVALLREPGVTRRLSFEPQGCRAVQFALEGVDRQVAAEMASQLRGRIIEAMRSPHANYVLQKMIKVLTPQEAPFIVEEVSPLGAELARHEYGCRIFCRLLEHAAGSPSVVNLLDVTLSEADELLRHAFGHYVVECALEHSLPQQRHTIVEALLRNPMRNAWNRNAAYVCEKALLYSDQEERRALVEEFANVPPAELSALARNQFGSMVMRAALRQPFDAARRIQEALTAPGNVAQLKGTKHGRRLLEDISFGPHRRA